MVADYAPGGVAVFGGAEGAVEPGFLLGAHEGAGGGVGDAMDVVGVPVEVGYGAVVLAGVEHY